MRKYLLILFVSLFIISCTNRDKEQGTTSPAARGEGGLGENAPDVDLHTETYKTEDGWGYFIYMDGRKYIHQPHIPAVQGLQAFRTEEDAQNTANLMMDKIRKNIMPPSVSVEELDSLGVVY